MAKLNVNTCHPRIVFGRGYDGRVITPKNSKTINVCVRSELITDDGKIAFHVIVKTPKDQAEDEETSQSLAVSWLLQELPSHMAQRAYWDFFRHTEQTPESLSNLPQIDPYKLAPIELDLHPDLAIRAKEAISHLRAVEERFEQAKEKLWRFATNNLPLGFAQTRAEAHTLLHFIEQVLSAGSDEGDYESYNARSAMSDYDELARRKDTNNHNYKSTLESLKRFAYGVSFPSTWHQRPHV
jgi:hypothetical protein